MDEDATWYEGVIGHLIYCMLSSCFTLILSVYFMAIYFHQNAYFTLMLTKKLKFLGLLKLLGDVPKPPSRALPLDPTGRLGASVPRALLCPIQPYRL